MMRTSTWKRAAMAVAAICLAWAGVIMVAPVAAADTLPNGLTVTCNQDSDIHSTCVVGGCPRVNGDYVVDALHYKYDSGGSQQEVDFKCINGQTARVGSPFNDPSVNFSVQGCRKKDLKGDWCTPWAHYSFAPAPKPAAPPPPVACPAGSTTATVPAGQTCTVAPKPVNCPDGSTVPAGQACPVVEKKVAPRDAVTMNISVGLGTANVNIASSADIPGTCTYDASSPGLPGVNKKIDLAPKGSTSFTTLSPPLLTTYHVVLSCTGQFDGTTVEFGRVEQDVTAAG